MPKNDDFLKTARERFKRASEEEHDIREEARTDLRYIAGEQWDPKIRRDREQAGRPALTFNKLPAFVQQIANEARQNKPQVKFTPVDSQADVDTAKVYEGLARHIQYDSDADVAYETALEYSASCSFGYFRFLTDYIGPDSFDQELKIHAVPDPFGVYGILGPACRGQEPKWAFVIEDIDKEEYKRQYPKSEVIQLGFEEAGRMAPDWIADQHIRVAEYWYVETEQRKIALLEDGSIVDAEQVPEGVQVVQERTVEHPVVKFCKINGVEILAGSETEWPGSTIPIIPVLGKQVIIEGKPKLFSLIRFAREPQQLFNYYKTGIAEQLSLASRTPWIGAEGQFEGHETEWAQANVKNLPFLQYKPMSILGQPVPPPIRNVYEPPIQALTMGAMQENDDIKAITNIYDPSLGARSNETSGKAILARQRESDVSNFHFLDNLSRAHRKGGRIIAELIPKIYDAAREIRIIGEDESQRVVKVNQQYVDEKGKPRNYQLSAGKYDITVTTGPAYSTKRQEAFDMLTQFAQAYPMLLQVAGDIVFRNSDLAGADELAERFKKTLPPQLQGDDKDGPAQIPPQVQAQMQALMQQHDQLTQALSQATEALNTKRLELESRERIASLQVQADLIKAEAQLNSQEGMAMLKAEIGRIEAMLGRLHEVAMRSQDQDFQAQQASAQQQADAQQAAQNQVTGTEATQ